MCMLNCIHILTSHPSSWPASPGDIQQGRSSLPPCCSDQHRAHLLKLLRVNIDSIANQYQCCMKNHRCQTGSHIPNVQISQIVTPYDHLHYRGGAEILTNCSISHTTSSFRNNMNRMMNTLTHLISLRTVCLVLTLVPSTVWAAWCSEWTHTDLCLWTDQSRQS